MYYSSLCLYIIYIGWAVEQILNNYEVLFRLGAFAFVLLLMLLWEAKNPRRIPEPGWNRRLNNLALVSIDALLVRYLMPIASVTMAEISMTRSWGLLNIVDTGFWSAFFLSLLFMDLLIYGQHVIMHQISLLWRIHRVHHTDLDFDVTTALRFHPLEIILSAFIKLSFSITINLLTPDWLNVTFYNNKDLLSFKNILNQ